MGKYDEFDKIILFLNKQNYNFNYNKIWHPSYILRNGNSNFEEWVNRIKNCNY